MTYQASPAVVKCQANPLAICTGMKHHRSQVCLPAAQIQHLVPHNDISVLLALNGGAELRAFAKPDGSFVFHNVPAGTHMLDVVAMHLMYPQVSADLLQQAERTCGQPCCCCCCVQAQISWKQLCTCPAHCDQLCCIMWLSMRPCSFRVWSGQCVHAGQAGRESHRGGNSSVC